MKTAKWWNKSRTNDPSTKSDTDPNGALGAQIELLFNSKRKSKDHLFGNSGCNLYRHMPYGMFRLDCFNVPSYSFSDSNDEGYNTGIVESTTSTNNFGPSHDVNYLHSMSDGIDFLIEAIPQ